MDFLGFALGLDLIKYVEYILGSQSGQRTADTVDYLLRCSVHGLKIIRSDSFVEFKLIQTLLKRGADPNMENLDRTPGGLFLQELYEQYSKWHWDLRNCLADSWWHSVKALLGSGANVNEKTHCRLKFCCSERDS